MTSLSERMPLRVRLTAAMLALVAVALTVFAVGSVSVLRGYLVDRVDGQLQTFTTDAVRKIRRLQLDLPTLVLRTPPEGLIQVRNTTGKIVFSKAGSEVEGRPGPVYPASPGLRLPSPVDRTPSARPASVPELRLTSQTVDAVAGGERWRTQKVTIDGVGTIVTAIDLSAVDQITMRLVLIEVLVGGGLLIVLVGVGVVIVRRSLRPLAEIEQTAGAIASGRLSLRVPDRDPRTEVGSLARSFNGMLAQIETAFRDREASEAAARRSEDRMRRFVADASHELRTPLTSIRGFAEFFRQNPGADPVRLMARVEAQAARMGLLVDDLLLLARMDQQRPLQRRPVDLLAIAGDAVHDAQVLAPDRDVSLVVDGDVALIVTGDEIRLRQVVGNLMNNALSHTPAGTPILVRAGTRSLPRPAEATEAGETGDTGETGEPTEVSGTPPARPGVPNGAYIEVSDKGPGLTAEQAERVFERFYRADPSRMRPATGTPGDAESGSAPAGGTGLGLSIVASLVKAHGGTVSVETAPGAGATFRVVLPLSPEALG